MTCSVIEYHSTVKTEHFNMLFAHKIHGQLTVIHLDFAVIIGTDLCYGRYFTSKRNYELSSSNE